MSNKLIWDTLSAIDVSDHIQQKNGLSFLSWAWAWGVLMDNFPDSEFEFLDNVEYSDGTMEVWVNVTVRHKEYSSSRKMWLPVMDYKNKSVVNPDSRKVSDSRMRCLTKCLALFGLGHYIYAGEDIPQAVKQENEKRQRDLQKQVSIVCDSIINSIRNDQPSEVVESWRELTEEEQSIAWVAKTKGGFFTQQEKTYIREALHEAS